MLLHSRTGPSEHRTIDLNTTIEEALNLAYHGARAETPGFNITMEKDLDPRAAAIEAFPQELLRVMLNLINNGFYAARKHAAETTDPGFEPTVRLTTRDLGDQVEIRVRDNGTGIPADIRDKLFRAVLHHQANRGGHRPRPVDQLRHRHTAAWRHDHGRQPSG